MRKEEPTEDQADAMNDKENRKKKPWVLDDVYYCGKIRITHALTM